MKTIIFIVLLIIIYTNVTLFVLRPSYVERMEGVEGMTLVMIRSSQNEDNTFIDSPDGMCDRANTPDFFCKISATRYSIENSTLLFRLPYSEFLFNISIDPSNK